jgi:hypothetical protein
MMMADIRTSYPPTGFRAPVFWLLLGAMGLLGLMLYRALASAVQDGLIAAIVLLLIAGPLASFFGTSRRGT